MTDSQAGEDEVESDLDKILEDLLGEYHEHKCISCNGTNGGCIN